MGVCEEEHGASNKGGKGWLVKRPSHLHFSWQHSSHPGAGDRQLRHDSICKVSGYLHIDGTSFPTNQQDPEAKLVVVGGGRGGGGRKGGKRERERERKTLVFKVSWLS